MLSFVRCQSSYTGQRIGGEILDSAVYAVFSALLWHTQELREMISSFGEFAYPIKITINKEV